MNSTKLVTVEPSKTVELSVLEVEAVSGGELAYSQNPEDGLLGEDSPFALKGRPK